MASVMLLLLLLLSLAFTFYLLICKMKTKWQEERKEGDLMKTNKNNKEKKKVITG